MVTKGFASWQLLVKKELLLGYRNKTVLISIGIIWLLFIAATVCTFLSYQVNAEQRTEANHLFRQQWSHQQRNPHDAGHFGTYLFKPINLLNVFDSGINDYSGSTYRIEAHIQHEMSNSEAEYTDAAMRFGNLTFAMILSLLVPLFLLFNTATSITGEKENGTLKMLLAQGLSKPKLIWTKVLANYLLIVFVVLPVFMVMAVAIVYSTSSPLLLIRLIWIMISFLLYYMLIALVGTLISAVSVSSGKALLAALCFWIFTSVIFPKAVAGFAERSYPLMSRAAFTDQVEQAYRKGLDGKDPYAARGTRYMDSLMKKYRVDSVSALPFNVEGLTLQYNEDYRAMAFNHYYKQIEQRFDQQQEFLSMAGVFDPFVSARRFSMAMAGSDFYHHRSFFKQARDYRNQLIRKLNLQLAMHGKDVKGEYVVGPQYFSQLKDFSFQLPGIGQVLLQQQTALLSILGWIFILTLLLNFIALRSLALSHASA